MPWKRDTSVPLRAESFALNALLQHLPSLRGKLTENEALAPQTWFGVGGHAEILFKPADEDDLAQFLQHCPAATPVTVIGVASNLIIRDGGIPGVVIKLGPAFALVRADGENVHAGAAAIDLNVARAAQVAGIGGLEFLCGIPGSVGGGLRMNAGCYGSEFKDVVESVTALDRQGKKHTMTSAEMGFSYRHSDVAEDMVFISAKFKGRKDDPSVILARMQDIQKARAESQPIREKTGGSTFANPESQKSWQLIEAAGCRGLKIGSAQVSEKHCNFLINTGDATASEIEALGEEVRRRVKDNSGIDLRWEIKRIGLATSKGKI